MKNLFLLLFTFMTVGVSAQISGGVNDGMNYGLTLIPTMDRSLDEVEGSAHYHKDFVRGTVNIDDKKPLEVFLRYNVAQERMEIKTDFQSSDIYYLPSGSKADYMINSENYVLDKITVDGKSVFGYFIELYKGDDIRLVKKPEAHFTEGEKAKTGYGKDKPARISIEEQYYIVSAPGQVVNVRPKTRDLRKAFNSSEAQDYLKNNKVRSEADLIAFVAHLD